MKKITLLTILVTLGLLTGCNPEPSNDPEIVKGILREYFDGIKKRDVNKMNAVTTTDFVLFEDGRVWNNDSLIFHLNQFASFDGTWTFDQMKINMDESSADVVYLDHGDLIFNDTEKVSYDWIESATFRKINGEWKMNFLHSTVKK